MKRNYNPRKCKRCKKEFKPTASVTKFCLNCRTFICQYCNKKFIVKDCRTIRPNKFCSRKCYLKNRWGKNICPICKKPVPSINFKFCSKKCAKESFHISYQKSVQKKIKNYYNYRKKLFQFLGNKCQICGFNNPKAFTIHHPDKNNKGKMNQSRWKRYWEERNKIQLVCANCHLIIHSLK